MHTTSEHTSSSTSILMYTRGAPSVSVTFCAFSTCLFSLSNSVWIADQSLMCILFCKPTPQRARSQRLHHVHNLGQKTAPAGTMVHSFHTSTA